MTRVYGNSLQHHGIKGQKWGVRRYQNPDGSLTQAGRMRYLGTSEIGAKALAMDIPANSKFNDEHRRKHIRYVTGKEVEPVLKTIKRSSPDEGVIINKGSTVKHITLKDTDVKPNNDRVLFVTADKGDNYLYSSVLAASIIKHNSGKPVKQLSFELKNNLNAPSKRESIQLFKEQYSKHSDEYIDYFSNKLSEFARNPDFKSQFTKEEQNPQTFKDRFNSKMKKSWLENEGYQLFNMGFNDTEALKSPIYKEYRQLLKEKGYNALVDENDSKKSIMGGKMPLIILDQLELLGDVKVKDITNDSIIRDYNKWVQTQKVD